MTTLANILKQKGYGMIGIGAEATMRDVIGLLAEKRIGAVVVQSAEGKLLGILSERDVVRSLAAKGPETLELTAGHLMTPHPTTATPATTIFEAERLMTDGRFRHLPVLDGETLVGLVSIGDVVKSVLEEHEAAVQNLREYVAGSAA